MSRSPERISSYRRHFEDSSSSSYQVRMSSPSPTRRDTRCAGAGSMRVEKMGRRTGSASRKARVTGYSGSTRAMMCVGFGGERPVDLDAAAAENQEFLSTRSSEKREMIVLNDRLAIYIDKARSLEQQNKLFEAEIEARQSRFVKPSGLRLLYEEQLRELRKLADQMRVKRDVSLTAKQSTALQLEDIKARYEDAVERRKKAELDTEAFRPDVDKATSSRIALEKHLEQLGVEIEFLNRVHRQEIDELAKQIYTAHVTVESSFDLPDLGAALKQIQAQYDDISAKNLQEMDAWYKSKFEDLTSKTSMHVDTIRSLRGEIACAKKEILNKERELDTLRTKNEVLEAQIREARDKYKREEEGLEVRVEALQRELRSTKEKIALHLRKYQELLSMKMSLEMEITTYRKLIEGEDLRLADMVHSMSLTSRRMTAISSGMSVGMGGGGTGGAGGMGDGMGAGGMGVGMGGVGDGGVGGAGSAGVGGDGMGGGVGGAGGGMGPGMGGAELGGGGGMGSDGGSGGAGGTGGADDTGGAGSSVEGMGPGGEKEGEGGGSMAAGMGDGSTGYDTNVETYAEQAEELTERRTVLIRTVKTEDDGLETAHQDQTYTITGAGDE